MGSVNQIYPYLSCARFTVNGAMYVSTSLTVGSTVIGATGGITSAQGNFSSLQTSSITFIDSSVVPGVPHYLNVVGGALTFDGTAVGGGGGGSVSSNLALSNLRVVDGISTTNLFADTISTGSAFTGGLSMSRIVIESQDQRVAIGSDLRPANQGAAAIAIGYQAGQGGQASGSIAIGRVTYGNQGEGAIALGDGAGAGGQGDYAIAIGMNAGNSGIPGAQPTRSIVINADNLSLTAPQAGSFVVAPIRNDTTQSNVLYYNTTSKEVSYGSKFSIFTDPVAIGTNAGAGSTPQQSNTVAIGSSAGFTGQSSNAVAIGFAAGGNAQGSNSIAIGQNAGLYNLGTNSVAIGGAASQQGGSYTNTLVLNASGAQVNPSVNDSFYVAPMRYAASSVSTVGYNVETKEVTYGGPVYKTLLSTVFATDGEITCDYTGFFTATPTVTATVINGNGPRIVQITNISETSVTFNTWLADGPTLNATSLSFIAMGV